MESGVFAMIGTNANSFQVNTNAAQSAAQTARTQTSQSTESNRAAVEQKVETRVESDVKREEAGKSAAEQMRKENIARTEKPEEGIELEISKKGLAAEQDAKAQDNKAADQKSATEQRVEEQQKVRERIKEQVEKELDDEEKEAKQVERREEDKKEQETSREKIAQGEDEARKQNITNYAGYTNAQLQQMAQKGEISQNDYKAEIEKREEKLQNTQQSLSQTEKDMAENTSRIEKVERQTGAVETAFDEESNQNINAETRAEIVQNLENPQQNTTVQQNNQREQQQRAYAQWQNDFGFLIR